MPGTGFRISQNFGLNVGLFLLLTVIVLGFAVTFGVGKGVDIVLLREFALRAGASPDWLIGLARGLSWLFNPGQRTVITLGIAAWFLWDRRYVAALTMVVVPPLAAILSSILKEAFARPRPDIVPHLDDIHNLSFPSGHASAAAAFFLVLALLVPGNSPRLRIVAAVICAFIIGTSRIMLGVHYPTDVLAGWLWGAGVALIGSAVAFRAKSH